MKKTVKWVLAAILTLTIACIGISMQKEEVVAADDWYKNYEYTLWPEDDANGVIMITNYTGKSVKSIYVPAETTIDGITYKTCLSTSGASIWDSTKEKLTTIKFQKGVKVNICHSMFEDLSKLKSVNVEVLDMSDVMSVAYMFGGCSSLTKLNVSKWDTSNIRYLSGIFSGCKRLKSLDVTNWDVSNVIDMGAVFNGCEKLKSLNLSKWDTSNVACMDGMFAGCKGLTKLNLNKWDTSSLESIGAMFAKCSNLKSLNIKNWDVSNVTNMFNMFGSCEKLATLDVSKWDTSKVTNMVSVFDHCKSLTKIDVSNWDVSKVTDMDYMFYKCQKLKKLDLHKWKTAKVTTMKFMFGRCFSMTSLNLKGWNTKKVTSMEAMFESMYSITSLDLSSFDMRRVTDTSAMFLRNGSLKTIKTPKNVKEAIPIKSSLSYVKKTGNSTGTKIYNDIPKGKKSITLVCTAGKAQSTTITSISSAKKKIKLTWTPVIRPGYVGGVQYEVQVSTNKNFTDSVGSVTNALPWGRTYCVEDNVVEETKATIKGLEKGKTYYVRVRAFVYGQRLSSWSPVKKIKVK